MNAPFERLVIKSPNSTFSKQDNPLKMDELFMFLPKYKLSIYNRLLLNIL